MLDLLRVLPHQYNSRRHMPADSPLLVKPIDKGHILRKWNQAGVGVEEDSMRRMMVAALALLPVWALVGPGPAAAEYGCAKGAYLHPLSDLPELFWGKDANGNGVVCVRGAVAPDGTLKVVVVTDDK
jgi:hypothetical protein